MERQITLSICLILFCGITIAKAQEYRRDFGNSPELAIEFAMGRGGVTIEGHDSDELIIQYLDYEPLPERAQGLRTLSSTGVDNSGIGLSVTEENGTLNIVPTTRGDGEYLLSVPNRVHLKIEGHMLFGRGDVEVQNHRGEIEILSRIGDISLRNVTGPIIVHNSSGNVEVEFTELSQVNPTSISIPSGFIDITFPADTRADFKLRSGSGEIYTDLDITLVNATGQNSDENSKTSQEADEITSDIANAFGLGEIQNPYHMPWQNTPGRQIEGILNGGGVEMSLNTLNGNIYLRRQE